MECGHHGGGRVRHISSRKRVFNPAVDSVPVTWYSTMRMWRAILCTIRFRYLKSNSCVPVVKRRAEEARMHACQRIPQGERRRTVRYVRLRQLLRVAAWTPMNCQTSSTNIDPPACFNESNARSTRALLSVA